MSENGGTIKMVKMNEIPWGKQDTCNEICTANLSLLYHRTLSNNALDDMKLNLKLHGVSYESLTNRRQTLFLSQTLQAQMFFRVYKHPFSRSSS